MSKSLKKFKVVGEGVNKTVEATSPKQAKLRAGFRSGLFGPNLTSFMKIKNVQIRRVG